MEGEWVENSEYVFLANEKLNTKKVNYIGPTCKYIHRISIA